MLYTAINVALVVALVFTCGFSFAMLREFRRFKAHAGVYGEALREASRAMEQVDAALARTHDEGAQTVISLGERLEAAQRTLSELKTTEAAASAQLLRLRERIHEARDAASEAAAAIRAGEDSGAFAPSRAPVDGGVAKGRESRTSRKNPDSGNGGSKSRSRKTTPASAPITERESFGQQPGAHEERVHEARVQEERGQHAPDTACAEPPHRLSLAAAETTEQNALRTRKILSWPVIRRAGIAAGA